MKVRWGMQECSAVEIHSTREVRCAFLKELTFEEPQGWAPAIGRLTKAFPVAEGTVHTEQSSVRGGWQP